MRFPKVRRQRQAQRSAESRREYRTLRLQFLREHRWCEIGETCRHVDDMGVERVAGATDVHHRIGRGKHYLDVTTWLAACRACHVWVEAHPELSYERGYSLKRNEYRDEWSGPDE